MIKINTFVTYAEAKQKHDVLINTILLCDSRDDLIELWKESQDTINKLCEFYQENAEAVKNSIESSFKQRAEIIKLKEKHHAN